MSTITSQFTIRDEYQAHPETCTIYITIIKTETHKYDITYDATYTHEIATCLHPLAHEENADMDGIIVHKNQVTDGITQMLLMSDDRVQDISGFTSPMEYKCKLMRSLLPLCGAIQHTPAMPTGKTHFTVRDVDPNHTGKTHFTVRDVDPNHTGKTHFTVRDVDPNHTETCTIYITIIKTETHKYDITYDATYTHESAKCLHPLANEENADMDGIIVHKNQVTDGITQMLLMPDDRVQDISGFTSPMEYKCKLMRSLQHLWD